MKDEKQQCIAAVVLAAGGSTRFGSPKQLAERDGEPLVKRAARSAVEAGARPVFVVLGAGSEAVVGALAGMQHVECLTNPEWEKGLASSLAVGLRAVLATTECEAGLVTLADQPFVDAAALSSLIASFCDDRRVIASSYDGTIGVPALFAREFLEELSGLKGDAGAGAWLREHSDMVTAISLQKAALDVDNPSDSSLLG